MPWKFRGRSRIRGRVPGIRAVEMSPLSLALFAPLIGEERYGSLLRVATRAREDLAGSSQDWEAKWLVAAVLRGLPERRGGGGHDYDLRVDDRPVALEVNVRAHGHEGRRTQRGGPKDPSLRASSAAESGDVATDFRPDSRRTHDRHVRPEGPNGPPRKAFSLVTENVGSYIQGKPTGGLVRTI
jgi:hypothetical protein